MDLSMAEQKLIAEFRRLDKNGQQELLDFASLLHKRAAGLATGQNATDSDNNQCQLDKPDEKRPESSKEPLFTE